jgi:hypothetical protein
VDHRLALNVALVTLTTGAAFARASDPSRLPHSVYEGNGWCMDTNIPVNYRWAVSGDTLTLTLDGPDGRRPASANVRPRVDSFRSGVAVDHGSPATEPRPCRA